MPKKKATKSAELPHGYLSFTQCNTFIHCPALYKAKYIDGKPEPVNYYMKFGRAVHVVLEKICKAAAKVTDPESQGVDSEDVTHWWNEASAKEFTTGEMKPTDVQQGLDRCIAYAQKVMSNIDSMVKEELDRVIETDWGVHLRVRIDRLNVLNEEMVEVVDHKSGAKILSKDELREDPQLNIYGYFVSKMLPHVKMVRLTHHQFMHGFDNSVDVPVEQFTQIAEYIKGVLRGIAEEKKFRPRLNEWCYGCPVKDGCKEYARRKETDSEAIEDNVQAHDELVDVQAKLSLLTKRKKMLQDHFKLQIEQSGEVLIEERNVRYYYAKTSGVSIDVQKLQAVLKKYNLNLIEHANLSITKEDYYTLMSAVYDEVGDEEAEALKGSEDDDVKGILEESGAVIPAPKTRFSKSLIVPKDKTCKKKA